MQWEDASKGSIKQAGTNTHPIIRQNSPPQTPPDSFGVSATTVPPTHPQTTMQRADEIGAIQRMLNDAQTSAVILIGNPGVGKSTLAALWYQRLQMAQQQGLATPRYLVWLTLGTYSTLPDIIAAILNGLEMKEPGLFILKPEQQIATLLRALRRQQENALIVLDQFELLLHPEINQGVAGRGALPAFLNMLQTDLGNSRILLTSYQSPYNEQQMATSRVRSYLVSRISLPEGVALLQQRGLKGSPEELSFLWQHCMGQVFALVLFSALLQLSGISLSYMLNAEEYHLLWAGDVTANLIASVYYFLNPIQRAIVHVLSLFNEPVVLEGIIITITGNSAGTSPNTNYSIETFEHEVQRLVQIGIIQPILNGTGQPSYTLHSLLRQHVLEHFLEEGHENAAENHSQMASLPPRFVPGNPEAQRTALAIGHTQVAAYYRQMIERQCPPQEQRKSLRDVAPIIAAVRHLCLGWRWQRACDLLFEQSLHESMVQWGAWNTLIGLYTAMLPPLGVLLRHDESLVAGHVAMLYGRIGEHQQSKNYFEQTLTIQRQINDIKGEATTLANQGELQRVRGEYELAHKTFEYALALNEQQPDANLRCILLHNLGLLSHHKKEYGQALRYYVDALKLAFNLDKKQYIGMILTNLGMLLYEKQQLKEALALLIGALQLRQELEDPTSIMLERFLVAVEQKMGNEAYATLRQEALKVQTEVFSRFAQINI